MRVDKLSTVKEIPFEANTKVSAKVRKTDNGQTSYFKVKKFQSHDWREPQRNFSDPLITLSLKTEPFV